MPIYWSKHHKRWRFEFDSYIQGQRHRATKLLPAGWSKAEADEFGRAEGTRLSKIAAGLTDEDPLIETAVLLYLGDKQKDPDFKSFKTTAEHLAAIFPAYAGKRMSELKAVAAEVNQKRARSDGKGALSDATVKQRLSWLRAACRWAWKRHDLTKHDPTTKMTLPSVSNERHVYRDRADMLRTCRACVNHGARIAIRVAFYSGMRLGEIMQAYPDGEALILEDTKNGDRRVVPVHPKIAHLTQFLPLPGPKITIQRATARALKKVGLTGTTFHDLRHSAASEMINAGVDLYTVGQILGHRDSKSSRRYAHLNADKLKAAVGKIGRKQA